MDELNSRELELEQWKALPSRMAACLALGAFAVAVIGGMLAGNAPLIVVFRALLAMLACWCLAWFAGGVIVHAVSRDDSMLATDEDISELEHAPDASVHATDSAAV